MHFIPVNNYLYVSEVADEETVTENTILLPQDYRPADSPFAVVELQASHSLSDGTLWAAGLRLVVEAHMLRDIQHGGQTFTVVKQGHVIGVLSD